MRFTPLDLAISGAGVAAKVVIRPVPDLMWMIHRWLGLCGTGLTGWRRGRTVHIGAMIVGILAALSCGLEFDSGVLLPEIAADILPLHTFLLLIENLSIAALVMAGAAILKKPGTTICAIGPRKKWTWSASDRLLAPALPVVPDRGYAATPRPIPERGRARSSRAAICIHTTAPPYRYAL